MSAIKGHAALVAAAMLWASSGSVLAASSTLQVIIGGEAYDGPPRFEVTFDGRVLGEGVVEAAIDTGTVGRFADAADKADYVESISFDIPEDVFKPGAEIRVRLVNEAYGGEGSNRDRNLYLAAVAVNGRAVTLSGLSTQGTSADTENEVLGEFLVLRDGNEEGVSRAPAGGWPLPGATIAATAEPPIRTEVAQAQASAAKLPVAIKAIELPGQGGGIETVSIESGGGGDGTAACTRDELYNVVGFNESSNDLTPQLMARLDQIVTDIGNERCRVLVTGYSSKQGDHATNALFAIERAQKVLGYLREAGLRFERATATGGGATEQFGATASANRRVVISVGP